MWNAKFNKFFLIKKCDGTEKYQIKLF